METTWQAGPWGGGGMLWAVYKVDAKTTVLQGIPRELAIAVAADHNAALASPAGVDLALVRSTLESKIKDDRYHPQFILGMAFAHQLLESVAAGADELRQLVEAAALWKVKVHGNGFVRLYLSDNHMLHFYSSDVPRQVVTTDIHDHRFDFESKILQGVLCQQTFEETDGTQYEVYTDDGDSLIPTGRSCGLRTLGIDRFVEGTSYRLEAGVIHCVWPEPGNTCVTDLVRSYDPAYKRAVRVYVKTGQKPDNTFNNKARLATAPTEAGQ